MDKLIPGAGDALLVVDVQNDFLPGGALGVPDGDRVLAPINKAIGIFLAHGLPIFASRDWHPAGHCSFREQGGPWPVHCVADTSGAAFSSALDLPPIATLIYKATRVDEEAYSVFGGTGFEGMLRHAGVRRIFIGGLATDYCVLATTRDARMRGFGVVVLTDAVCAVNVQPGDGERALAEMKQLGARFATSGDLA
ncbi:MAG TPA: isochorismatase family protein [Gallionella sp.]|nr:isochorismatase family protein [Gallionella sp.]